MRRFTHVAVLGAIAFILMRVAFSLPFLPPFLKYDPSEVPALIATFALGPLAGLSVEMLKALLIQVLGGPDPSGGLFGVFMNLLAGATLVGVAGWYYLIERTKPGAVRALILGVLAMTGVMIVANIFLTPIFFGIPRPQVIALVLPALLPFNLVKGAMSALIAFYLYKRVGGYLYEWVGDRAV
ncbi:MAG: ECF transporter S component, partial [Anaerolineales bacterium]